MNCPVLLCVTHVSRPLTGSERTYGGNFSGPSFLWPLHILATIIEIISLERPMDFKNIVRRPRHIRVTSCLKVSAAGSVPEWILLSDVDL